MVITVSYRKRLRVLFSNFFKLFSCMYHGCIRRGGLMKILSAILFAIIKIEMNAVQALHIILLRSHQNSEDDLDKRMCKAWTAFIFILMIANRMTLNIFMSEAYECVLICLFWLCDSFSFSDDPRFLKYKVSPYAPSLCLMTRGLSGEIIEKIPQHDICNEIFI